VGVSGAAEAGTAGTHAFDGASEAHEVQEVLMYCMACGGEVPNGANYCLNCGASLSPAGSARPSSTGGSGAQSANAWEYSESRATFPPNAIPWYSLATSRPPASSVLPVRALRLIDMVVASLVRQKRTQGWEPAERTDAPSLWKAGKVEFRVRRREPLWALVTFQAHFDVVLVGVRVTFRRVPDGPPPGQTR
jgi:hypothetical protein